MHQMLATATATAVASCTQPEVQQTVTITPLPTTSTTDTSTAVAPPPPPTTSAIATASATANATSLPPTPPNPTAGYLVVDMLPAPARCLGVATSTKTTARFRRDGSGIVLDIAVTLPATTSLGAISFTGTAATVWGGTIVTSTVQPHTHVASARVRPLAAASGNVSIGVTFEVSCGSAGVGQLAVTSTFTAPATESTTAHVLVHDY